MGSKLRRAQRFGDPLRLRFGAHLLERWRWEQTVVHQRKPRDTGGPNVEPSPSDCAGRGQVWGHVRGTLGSWGWSIKRTGIVKEADDEAPGCLWCYGMRQFGMRGLVRLHSTLSPRGKMP